MSGTLSRIWLMGDTIVHRMDGRYFEAIWSCKELGIYH